MDNLEAILWTLVAALSLIGEVLSASFFLVFFTLGAVVGLGLAVLGFGVPAQIAVFIAVSVASMFVLRPALLNRLALRSSEGYKGGRGITGRSATVTEDIASEGSGTIELDGGEYWTARAVSPRSRIERGDRVRILDTDGITALVDRMESERED